MSGAVQPASSMRCLISGTAAAASGRFTVTRTISDPAFANSMHCSAVARASAVSVIVIDWTTTGAPPPTSPFPTLPPTAFWLVNRVTEPIPHDSTNRLRSANHWITRGGVGLSDGTYNANDNAKGEGMQLTFGSDSAVRL